MSLNCIWVSCVNVSIAYCFPLKVQDGREKEIRLLEPPKRIVSLAPTITETLFALDLNEEIVGVTIFCDYPPQTKEKAKVGSYIRPNIEEIVALEPDLVLSSMQTHQSTKRLEDLGISVFTTSPQTLEESLDSILKIGKITGRQKEATLLVSELNKRIKVVADRTRNLKKKERPSVFWQLGSKPLVTAGPQTFAHDLIVLAGGRNIASEASIEYPRYSLEAILHENPDIILIIGMTKDDYSKTELERWSKWKDLSAVRNNRIHLIDLSIVTRATSPRSVEGLERIARIIHPELFLE